MVSIGAEVHHDYPARDPRALAAGRLPEIFAPRYLIRDRDQVYGAVIRHRLRAMGIHDKPIAPGSPWQNGFAERLIGSIRRECVDHVIALGEAHLRGILRAYGRYYNDLRTHRSLDKDAPFSRPVQRIGHITSHALSADSIIATCESEFSVHTALPNPPNPHRTNRPGGARLVLSPPAVQPLTRKPGLSTIPEAG
jgi:Integrase core domain